MEFDCSRIVIRDGKGQKDRVTMLPDLVQTPLQRHLVFVQQEHETAMRRGYGGVELPHALARKFPNAHKQWGWQYVFPASKPSMDPRSGAYRRHHLHESVLQRAVKQGVQRTKITKHVGCHTFRHCFATDLLADGYDIRTVQELMGHRDVKTTMIYTHVLNRGGRGVRSPLDHPDRGGPKTGADPHAAGGTRPGSDPNPRDDPDALDDPDASGAR